MTRDLWIGVALGVALGLLIAVVFGAPQGW